MSATRAGGSAECRQLGFLELRDRPEICRLPINPAFAPNEARLGPQTAFSIFERSLFDTPPLTAFQVGIAIQQNPTAENSIRRGLPSTAPVLVRTTSADTTDLPRATLTLTPL